MKKTSIKLVVTLGIGMMIGSAGMAAASSSDIVQATVSKLKLVVDGQVKQTAAPLSYKGTTYVPIRDAAGLFDYDVKFDSAKQQIQFNSKGESILKSNDLATTEWISLKDASEYADEIHLGADFVEFIKDGKSIKGEFERKTENSSTFLRIDQLKEAGVID